MDRDEESPQPVKKSGKQHNVLPLWGNEASMNLNALILTNIQSSSYFKVSLFKLKTYHEVVDEIYYHVKHLEPWERGSRKTSGQTGMCGGVRGVGSGGIVSTAYCLLYKLYTLRLTRKQLNGLLTHTDSPYIRALGFMYIRYTQPPSDLYDWYEEYLQDEEEVDVKAGGGQTMTIGQMLRQWLVKLDWFSTLFPRIPVPIQKSIEQQLEAYMRKHNLNNRVTVAEKEMHKRRGVAPPEDRSSEYGYHDDRMVAGGSRDYYQDDEDRGGGSQTKGREYYTERQQPRSRSPHDRSRERSSREYYKEKDYRRSGDRERSHHREHREKDRDHYYREERDSLRSDSKHRDRDRKYR